MRVLITNDGEHAHKYIRLGLARAFEAAGHQVHIFELGSRPLFDVFDEFEPELLMTQTYNLNEAMLKCASERPALKIIMKASDWGDIQNNIDLKEYPVLVAQPNEIDMVTKLMRVHGGPSFVHCHYHPNRIESTHGRWKRHLSIPIVGLMSAADIYDYTGGQCIEAFKSDITFIGGYWEYKARTLNKYILRLCNVNKPYKVKIFGNRGWGVPQYCGNLDTQFVKDALASATICPNVSEPHSQVFGYDIVERPWKILANGGFCISDYVESMDKDVFTNDELVLAKTPEEFEEQVNHFLKYPNERLAYMKRGRDTVLDKHTYFHRVAYIFENLNMPWEAQHVLEVYNKLRENV